MADERTDEPVPRFPLYVRILAVLHVLSLVLGPAGFILFGSVGCILWTRHRAVDELVLACWALALGSPAVCALYRKWFVQWGRANWPDGKPRD